MNFSIKKIAFSFLTLVFLATSCNQNEQLIPVESNPVSTVKTISPTNTDNPFDEVGVIHNQGVAYFMKNYAGKKMTVSEIVSVTDKYLLSNTSFTKNMRIGAENATFSTNSDKISDVLADKDNNFKNVVSKAECSDYAKTKLSTLFSITLSEKENESADYNLLHSKIIAFEKDILEDKKLSEEDRKLVLMSTSISRHSLYFWYTSIPKSANGRIARKWWEWVLVGVADAAGGVAGAAVGSGVASAAGAVAGAVGASSGMASLLEWAQE